MVKIVIITAFKKIFKALNYGIFSKALENKLIELNFVNPRDFAKNKYKSIDDKPFGGGPGMVMKYEILKKSVLKAQNILGGNKNFTILLSPQGKVIDFEILNKISKYKKIIFVSGRYKGIDERFINKYIDKELSIGNYILTGGELPAMVIIDAISRFIPGVIKKKSFLEDSFINNLLDYPNYTRPEVIDGISIPKILKSGNHKKILKWRLKQKIGRTWLKKPEILKKKKLNHYENNLLKKFISEYKKK